MTITVGEALRMAHEHRAAGRLADAEAVCRKLLSAKPNQHDALHLLGFLIASRDREQGIAMIRRAIEIQPKKGDYHNNLGCVLVADKQYGPAIASFRRAIELNPGNFEAYRNLGGALLDNRDPDAAIVAYQEAVRIRPDSTATHDVLIRTLKGRGKIDDAVAAARVALQSCPDLYEALNTIGLFHFEKNEFAEAAKLMRRAIAASPTSAQAHMNLAIALRRDEQFAEALAMARRCVELDSDTYDHWLTLGNCLRSCRLFEEAEPVYRKVIELRPDYSEAFANLGALLRDLCRFDEARQVLRRAIALKVDSPNAHWNYSLALLLDGEFTNGFVEYEWRWLRDRFTDKNRAEPGPRWFGSDLAGKTILVYSEQGFGDVIQMARYIPLLAERGARVILKCQPELQKVLRNVEGVSEVMSRKDKPPAYDFQIPVMSLPLAFETVEQTIPRNIPYVRADAEKISHWADRLTAPPGQRRIGLVWAGQPKHEDDVRRSIPFSDIAVLADVANVKLFSLQKGPAAEQLKSASPAVKIVDLGADLKDFSDTAAVLENLDLVITVDTAVAHLAGAMGKPCWVLLASVNDWRWMRDRGDSPWYPTVRLFRQAPGEKWLRVIERAVSELGR